jgi:pimeloyl-ACP methyl ester carboxylesterase
MTADANPWIATPRTSSPRSSLAPRVEPIDPEFGRRNRSARELRVGHYALVAARRLVVSWPRVEQTAGRGAVRDMSMLLSDGRALAFTDCGASSGVPVFYCHGAPGSRLDVVWLEDAFRSLSVRVICADRPGYGGSSPHPGRTLSGWSDDAAALADYLGVERFAVMGFSSGGPYAVACATLLPGRVTAAGIVAGVTDMGWSDAWDGFEEAEATLMRVGDEAKVAAWCEQHYGPDGARFFDSTGDLAPADVEVLQDETMTAGLFATITEAFRQGVAGYAQDVTIQSTPWFLIHGPSPPRHGCITVKPTRLSRSVTAGIPPSSFPKALSRHSLAADTSA